MRPCAITGASEVTQKELQSLLQALRSPYYSGKHLEIGTASGGTLWQMLLAVRQKERPQFVVVDPMCYFPNQLQVVKSNLLQHGIEPSEVNFRVQSSAEAFELARSQAESFDFIFVDGAHKMRYVVGDLRWASLLNPGGKIGFHDYSPHHPGVRLAVDRFLKKNRNYRKVSLVDSLLVVEKIAASSGAEVSFFDQALGFFLTPVQQMAKSLKKHWKPA